MEKKRALLLTVIAVATIAVAVIGATFAFFTVGTTGSATTTTVTTKTNKIGSVALTAGTASLYLHPTNAQMKQASQGTPYYSTTTDTAAATSSTPATVATISASGGDANSSYSCTFTVTIESSTAITSYQTGDITITLASGSGISGVAGTYDYEDTTGTGGHVLNGSFTASGASASATITAYMTLTNKNSNQNYLADKTVTTDITVSALTCTTA